VLPDKYGQVRVRSTVAGELELRAEVGQLIVPGQILAIVEGDQEIESLSVRKTSKVVEVLAVDGSEIGAGVTLMVVEEVED
jgi:biotin carboxyl carrier protein